MTRGFGEVDLFQQLVPEWLAVPVALLTQLGSLWFVTLVLVAVALYVDRDDALVIWGVLMGGTAIWRAIKQAYFVPRPDQPLVALADLPGLLVPLYDFAVIDTGAGFPSGHAVTTTIVYLLLAEYLGVSSRRRRYAAALFLVGLVGATRITLGIHYFVDVLGGAVIGHGVVVASRPLRRRIDRVRVALLFGIALTAMNLGVNVLVAPLNLENLVLLTAPVTVLTWWVLAVERGWTIASLPRSLPPAALKLGLAGFVGAQLLLILYATTLPSPV